MASWLGCSFYSQKKKKKKKKKKNIRNTRRKKQEHNRQQHPKLSNLHVGVVEHDNQFAGKGLEHGLIADSRRQTEVNSTVQRHVPRANGALLRTKKKTKKKKQEWRSHECTHRRRKRRPIYIQDAGGEAAPGVDLVGRGLAVNHQQDPG